MGSGYVVIIVINNKDAAMDYRIGSGRLRGSRYIVLMMAALVGAPAAAQDDIRYGLSLGTDYRQAELDWNIAGDIHGGNPNVLSELRWHDLEIAELNGALLAERGDVMVEAAGAYGRIISGRNQDSDYLGDNRQREFSRSNNDSGGDIADASLAAGYRFRLHDEAARHYGYIVPKFGYSLHRQDLQIRNGVQTVPASGPIAGLDSHYDAQWQGPWLGAALQLEAGPHTALLIELDYHWADFSAKANWNLRDDLAHPLSFRHDSRGSGLVATLAISHDLSRYWTVSGRLESQHWSAEPGRDTFYSVDPDTGQVQAQATRLNAVHWKSQALGVAATYRF